MQCTIIYMHDMPQEKRRLLFDLSLKLATAWAPGHDNYILPSFQGAVVLFCYLIAMRRFISVVFLN